MHCPLVWPETSIIISVPDAVSSSGNVGIIAEQFVCMIAWFYSKILTDISPRAPDIDSAAHPSSQSWVSKSSFTTLESVSFICIDPVCCLVTGDPGCPGHAPSSSFNCQTPRHQTWDTTVATASQSNSHQSCPLKTRHQGSLSNCFKTYDLHTTLLENSNRLIRPGLALDSCVFSSLAELSPSDMGTAGLCAKLSNWSISIISPGPHASFWAPILLQFYTLRGQASDDWGRNQTWNGTALKCCCFFYHLTSWDNQWVQKGMSWPLVTVSMHAMPCILDIDKQSIHGPLYRPKDYYRVNIALGGYFYICHQK